MLGCMGSLMEPLLASEAEIGFLMDTSRYETMGSSIPDKVILQVTEFNRNLLERL